MMHYYKRNLGDYAKKAGRLSMLEHGAYTLLLDAIYDRELFPTLEEALDWAWARDDAEVAAVKFVLSKFFILEDDRYIQKRVQEELEAYKAKAETNARVAKEREEKRKLKGRSEHDTSRNVHESLEENHESSPNHKPLTINQEPITSNQYIYTFDLAYVNANLLKSGRRPVDQKYIDELQPQFELYYANQHMADNKALVKFVQWIMRNQDNPPKQQSITKTTAQILAEQRMQLDQQQGQVIDVGESPKKPLLIEEVGRA